MTGRCSANSEGQGVNPKSPVAPGTWKCAEMCMDYGQDGNQREDSQGTAWTTPELCAA